MWERSGALAARLAGHGVLPGDLVATAIGPSADLVTALLGILRAGGVYVPMDPQAPADRTRAILADASPGLVVVGADPGRWDALLPPDLPRLPIPPADAVTGTTADPPTGGDDPAYVSFTSGSTGRPKGVVVPHRAVVRLVTDQPYCTIRPGDRVAASANPAFDATTFEVWSTLAAGGTIVAVPTPADLPLDEWIARLRADRITTMFLTTSLFHTIARERPAAFSSLATLVVGGEQLDLAPVRQVHAAGPPARLVNGYGPTETCTFVAAFECTPETIAGLERTPIGFALRDTTLLVLNDRLRPVPTGEVGELCVAGPAVALGYLHQPELTARRFTPEPGSGRAVYRTGDLVRQLPGGALEVTGRLDRQVKLRGFRIELEEIEAATAATGLVDAVFVEKVGDGPAATLVGFVLPARGTDDPTAQLRRRLGERLPAYMVPGRWVVLDRVPLGATGKVDRGAMLALLAPPAAPGPAGGPVELRRIWAEVLGVPHVSADDNFLDLGGNSVLAVQAASRISRELTVPVDPGDILLAETLGDFGESLVRR